MESKQAKPHRITECKSLIALLNNTQQPKANHAPKTSFNVQYSNLESVIFNSWIISTIMSIDTIKQFSMFPHYITGAEFSTCRKYRYALWRIWDNSKPLVMFIGLNPSTANEVTDDPTIRRVKRFAADWNFGGFYMMNLFALISPYPEDLRKSDDPLGENNLWIDKIASKCDKIIFAWGSFPEASERAIDIINRFNGYALIMNKDGNPRHPLYVKADIEPIPVDQNSPNLKS